jgi:adenosylmethionine-8-amino-7-oxononanoate aminotransferase
VTDHVFYPDLKHKYPVIVKGNGIYLWDDTGKKYVDACSGALVSNIGHCVEVVCEAISKQLKEVEFTHRFKFTNKPVQELARMIVNMAPHEINWVTFVSGGSEATESAMKMAREYFIEKGKPSKYKVISRWQSYHGNSLGALSMSGNIGRRKRYTPLLADFPHVSPAYCYRCPFEKVSAECGLECAYDIERAIIREGPENVAAVIVEPIVGSTLGAAVPKDGYMQAVRQICDEYDVLLIADEVMTGLGRTGANFAVDHWNVIPDMLTMAKGLGGGYVPIGAVAVREKVREAFWKGSGKFAHGFTYGSNPVAAAAGVAVLKYVSEHNLIENSKSMGRYLLDGLSKIAENHQFIGDVRGLGLMTGIEFVEDKRTKKPFDPKRAVTNKLINTALDRGLMLYTAANCADGIKGDAVMIAPPLTVTKDEIDMILGLFEEVISDVFELEE